MQNALIAQLVKRFPSAAQCAAALGISRQAMNQSMNRGTLSNAAALRAAALLNLDPGQALLINATSKDIPAPVIDASPCSTSNPVNNAPDNTNYAYLQSR